MRTRTKQGRRDRTAAPDCQIWKREKPRLCLGVSPFLPESPYWCCSRYTGVGVGEPCLFLSLTICPCIQGGELGLRAPCLEPWAVPPRSLGLCPLDSPPRSMPGALGCAPQEPRAVPPGLPSMLHTREPRLCRAVAVFSGLQPAPLAGLESRVCVHQWTKPWALLEYWASGSALPAWLLAPARHQRGGWPQPPFWAQICPHPRAAHPARGSPLLLPPCLSFQIVLFEKEKSGSAIYSTDVRRWAGPGPQVGGAGS